MIATTESALYRAEIVIDINDETAVQRAKQAEDKIRQVLDRMEKRGKALSRVTISPTARINDQITGPARVIDQRLQRLDRQRIEPLVALRDRATKIIQSTGNNLRRLSSGSWTVAIHARDMVSGTLRRIKNSIFSLQGAAAVALGFIGISKLEGATVGAAMTMETYRMSMEHWLKGNKTLAQETIDWLQKFADKTPFEMTDLFPAMTRSVGISDGNIGVAKTLLKTASDMAALQPGKTIQDAMEALADAQMGEFERMKEFQVKMTQAQYEAIGGWEGFITIVQDRVKGGAEKLGRTAIGRISTIRDIINGLFRGAGEGILESMSPRLEKITNWFDTHPKTVARWQDSLITFGRQASERFLAPFENTFRFIRTRYLDNPTFQKLSFNAKVNLILDDISVAMNRWIDGPGGEMAKRAGERFGDMMSVGLTVAAPAITQVGIVLGKAIAEGTFAGFGAVIKSSPLGAMIGGAILGGVGGSIIPGVGTGIGAVAGAATGLYKWGRTKAMDAFSAKPAEAAAGYSIPSYDITSTTLPAATLPAATMPQFTGDSDMTGYLNNQVYEPFRNTVNRADSWGRNLIGNFMRGRDSAGMSMGGWLSSQVYEPFRSIVNRADSWGRTLMHNFQVGINSVKITMPTILTPSTAAAPVAAHAAGGILTRPHLGLVAEAGPEAIIPLSLVRRNRALELYEQTGRMLGVRPYATGGFTAAPMPAPVGVSNTPVINLNFDLAGLVGQIIVNSKEDLDAYIEQVAAEIARRLKAIFNNMV